MKIKTSQLKGAALDWAVAKCEGLRAYIRPYEHTLTGLCILDADLVDMGTDGPQELRYSDDWSQGGEIIERLGIGVTKVKAIKSYHWVAGLTIPSDLPMYGDTPLVAAMRCFVTSKLGDEVDVPDELMHEG
jgi:hypothetical protein